MMTVQFPSDLVAFMDDQIGRGYASREDVVREAFRLLAQRDKLRAEIDKSAEQFNTGEFREYDEAGLESRFRELEARIDSHSQRDSQP
jgi:Arc/MetJ-type ribon-helix-helix transcriptional regulator